MSSELFNANPTIFSSTKSSSSRITEHSAQSLWLRDPTDSSDTEDESNEREEIDQDEIFGAPVSPLLLFVNAYTAPLNVRAAADLIRTIYDPEHPNTLEELRVVSAPQITVGRNHIKVEFTPTVPHCGMSTLIGTLATSRHGDKGRSSSGSARPCFLCGCIIDRVSLTILPSYFHRAVHSCAPSPELAQQVQGRYLRKAWVPPKRAERYIHPFFKS